MANFDKIAEFFVKMNIDAVKTKIDMMIEGILQGYVNQDGSKCSLEDIINTHSQQREVYNIPIVNNTF